MWCHSHSLIYWIEKIFSIRKKKRCGTCGLFSKYRLGHIWRQGSRRRIRRALKIVSTMVDCTKLCKVLLLHAAVLTLLAAYWIYETISLLVWISFGIGVGYGCTFLSILFTAEKLSNTWETYITIYILVFGVFVQTTVYLLCCEQCLAHLKAKAPTPYKLYRDWPLRLALGFAFLQVFLQFRRRFEKEMDFDEENLVTFKFLGATCFLGYVLGRKIRLDYRLDQAAGGFVFVCPGICKYIAMFMFFYALEFLLIIAWGSPIFLLAAFFRFYYFQEYLTYFGLSILGVVVGYGTAAVERGYNYRGPYNHEPMRREIHAEVKTNVILFTLLPMATRWYFRFQFEYPDYEEGNMVNFIMFSTNVAILLMYFVKQVYYHKYKTEDDRIRRIAARAAIEALVPVGLGVEAAPDEFQVVNDVNNNNDDSCTDTTSTGTFSNKSASDSSGGPPGNIRHYQFAWRGSNTTNMVPAPDTHQTSFATTFSRHVKMLDTTRRTKLYEDVVPTPFVQPNVNDFNANEVDVHPSTSFPSLRKPLGIMTINKRWRDQMLNPGHIKRLSYSSHVNRIAIPNPIFMRLRQPPTLKRPQLGHKGRHAFKFNSRRRNTLPGSVTSNSRKHIPSSSSLSSVDALQIRQDRRHRQRHIHTSSSSSSSNTGSEGVPVSCLQFKPNKSPTTSDS